MRGGAGDAGFFEHLGSRTGTGVRCELSDGEPEHHLGGRRVQRDIREEPGMIPVMIGIAMGLAVYAALGVKQLTKTIKAIIETMMQMTRNIIQLEEERIERK